MSNRPSDWSPLVGGDPCPGDPDAYSSVMNHWQERVTGAQAQATKLQGITSVDAESNRFRRVEQVAAEGQVALENMADAFVAAKDALEGWQSRLRDLQGRADEALKKAQAAYTSKADAQAQIGTLGAIADMQKKHDEQGKAKKALLMEEAAVAQGVIDAAQRVVDEVRDEYARESAAVVDAYALSVDGLWSAVSGAGARGSFGSSVEDVKATLLGDLSDARMRKLQELGAVVGEGPDQYEAFLDALSGLDAGSLAEFFGENPELARYPLAGTGDTVWDTATVKAWWGGLDADQRAALVHNAPGVVGNLNGVPYGVRDQANRALIEDLLVDDQVMQNTKDTLENVRKSARFQKGRETSRFIVSLDISNVSVDDGSTYNDVMAAVSVGDVDAAAKITMIVPGMNNNVDESIGSLTQTASSVYKEQKVSDEVQHAVVAWIGYESPQMNKIIDPNVTNNSKSVWESDMAVRGSESLASFYDGLNVTKSANSDIPVHGAGQTAAYNDAFVSLTSHSYGTTTAAFALTKSQTKVDNTIFYDSAGLDPATITQAWQGKWQVESRGDQQNIFFTDVLPGESLTARVGAVGGGRVMPKEWTLPGATEFSSRGGFDASGNYLEDVDEHGLFEKNDKEGVEDYSFSRLADGNTDGFLSSGTSSLYYGSRISLGDYSVVDKKLISPMLPGNPRVPGSGSFPYVDVDEKGKLSAEEVRRYAQEQGLEMSDLVRIEEE